MSKISELSDGGSLQSTDYLIAVRSGGNVKVQADGNLSLGALTLTGLTVAGNVSIDGGTIKLDGNYPVGTSNVALGNAALDDGSLTGTDNTAIGANALTANTTGTANVALGSASADANTTGNNLTALGTSALSANTTGDSNTALGRSALFSNTTASNNTAVGYQAGYVNTTGTRNTFLGEGAGYSGDGSYNTFIGNHAGYAATGGLNTFIGDYSGYLVTSGQKNTILGKFDGNTGGLDIRTSDNYIVLSDGDGNPRGYFEPSGAFVVANGVNKGIQVLGSGYTANTAGLSLGQYTSTRVYAQMPPSGQFEVWASSTGAVATFYDNGNVNVAGALSKGSGSFRIPHPLPELSETHDLVHSFIEGPQADNIYRGKVKLVDGTATVNIDTVAGMTEGTFALLNREVQCFTSNESGWTAVRGKVDGNILTIEAQDPACTDTISWMVVGERQDQHMFDTDWTDENGKVIVEPIKRLDQSPADTEAS